LKLALRRRKHSNRPAARGAGRFHFVARHRLHHDASACIRFGAVRIGDVSHGGFSRWPSL